MLACGSGQGIRAVGAWAALAGGGVEARIRAGWTRDREFDWWARKSLLHRFCWVGSISTGVKDYSSREKALECTKSTLRLTIASFVDK